MVAQANPFPGMNPFLELHWPDVHTRLLTYMSDALAELLPADLVVRTEQRVSVTTDHVVRGYRSDVAAAEPPQFPPTRQASTGASAATPVAEPEVVLVEPATERWLEIRNRDRLVTAVELLSPTNKREDGRAAYLQKQRDYLLGRANLVEIDLLRAGQHTVAVDTQRLRPQAGTCHIVCVSRAAILGRREVYRTRLSERLPAVRVPLRSDDPDIVLDLQPLVDRCYSAGRYWLATRETLDPPLPPDEAAWVGAKLREHGLA